MEVVPLIICHQPAFCRMLLWFFRRKLLHAIFRCSKPLHPSREFLEQGSNRGPLSWQMWATASKGKHAKAAAGAQTQLAGKHIAGTRGINRDKSGYPGISQDLGISRDIPTYP